MADMSDAMAPLVQLFFNPASGSYSAEAIDALAAAFAAEGASVEITASISGPPPVRPDATHVCIAGGDGTVRHVAMALLTAGCRVPVAIYPAGTVNLLARESPRWDNPAAFACHLLHGDSARPHYPAHAAGTLFLACASVGPDSLAVAGVSQRLKRIIGRSAYGVAFARLLFGWPRHRLCLTDSSRAWTCEAVFIAKSRFYAGPWSFAPQAKGSDGLLHVLALKCARRRDIIAFALALLRGQDPARLKGIAAFTCTDLTIEGPGALPVQLDGDIAATLPLRLSVSKQALLLR